MSEFYKTTFWERWFMGMLMFLPITALTSCACAFFVMDNLKTGLMVWAAEDAIFALILATSPTAEVFRKPWWDRD